MERSDFRDHLRDALSGGMSLDISATQQGLAIKVQFEKETVCEDFIMWSTLEEYLMREREYGGSD